MWYAIVTDGCAFSRIRPVAAYTLATGTTYAICCANALRAYNDTLYAENCTMAQMIGNYADEGKRVVVFEATTYVVPS